MPCQAGESLSSITTRKHFSVGADFLWRIASRPVLVCVLEPDAAIDAQLRHMSAQETGSACGSNHFPLFVTLRLAGTETR